MPSMTMSLATAVVVASLALPLAGCRRNQDAVAEAEGGATAEAPAGQSFTTGPGTDTRASDTPGPAATTGDASGGLGATGGDASLGGSNNAGGTLGATTGTAGDEDNGGEVMQDAVITTKVKAALVAEPVLKAGDINVDTREGEVTLTGVLDNQSQIDRAVDVARRVDGVRNVNNRLTVRK